MSIGYRPADHSRWDTQHIKGKGLAIALTSPNDRYRRCADIPYEAYNVVYKGTDNSPLDAETSQVYCSITIKSILQASLLSLHSSCGGSLFVSRSSLLRHMTDEASSRDNSITVT